MNIHTITLPAAIAALTLTTLPVLTSCAGSKPLGPLATAAVSQLKEAAQDLDVEGIAKEHACGIYIDRGRASAETAFTHEWPVFAPVFATTPSPSADLQWCTDYLGSLNVKIVSKPNDTASMAICGVVAFGAGFEGWPVESQAEICSHELSHILGQQRMGCGKWLANYATVSGRLSSEGTAYALSDAFQARYGVDERTIAARAKARAARFPVSYGLDKAVSSECVVDYFGAIRRALRERTGV